MREAYFQVKMGKPSASECVWTLTELFKSARGFGAKHVSKSKSQKPLNVIVELVKKSSKSGHSCGAKHISKSTCQRHNMLAARTTFGCWTVILAGGIPHITKIYQTYGLCSSFKNDGKRGAFEEGLQRCSRVAGTVQKTSLSGIFRGQGSDFLRRRGCIWSIRSAGLLRWFCMTGAAVRAGAVLLRDEMEEKKRIGTSLSALHSTSNFEWGLTELLCFWRWHFPKMEEVLQTCFFVPLSIVE